MHDLGRQSDSDLLKRAHEEHASGRIEPAEILYFQVLEADPDQPDAVHSYGLLLHHKGQHQQAVEWIKRAIALDSEKAHYHNSLGLALRALGSFADAATVFEDALKIKPDYVVAMKNLGLIRFEQGRLDEAADCFSKVVCLASSDAGSHRQLGRVLHAQRKFDAAEVALRKALALEPDCSDLHCELGSILRSQGRDRDAIVSYRRAVQVDASNVKALCKLSVVLVDTGEEDEAENAAQRALEIDGSVATAHEALGLVEYKRFRYEAAANRLKRALALEPGSAQVHNNLGAALRQCGHLHDALNHYRAALRIAPERPDSHLSRGMVLLALGEFEQGWPEYEWRRLQKNPTSPKLPRPLWDGSPLRGQRILVHTEQGFGDTFQFVRYARLIKERGGRVILACQPALAPLLSRCQHVDEVVPIGHLTAPEFDVYAPLLSLPAIFDTRLADVPNDVPYIEVDPELVDRWSNISESTSDFPVGISWQGNAGFAEDGIRSIPLSYFRGLSEVSSVRLFSLQRGRGAEQLDEPDCQFPVHTFDDDFDKAHGAFMDTAAVMKNLQLVITSDTAVAHLAGALGVPVWLALPHVADWRWLLDRDDSPWYPTMRLFRQPRFHDWKSVFERIRNELSLHMTDGTAKSERATATVPVTMAPNRCDERAPAICDWPAHPGPAARSSPRVWALSFYQARNFGDRLGYHVLNSVLPPNAELHHAYFNAQDHYRLHNLPDGTADLLVLGIGNSLFGPVLTDELLDLLGSCRRAVGIFGLQYTEGVSATHLAKFLDRLDVWFARSKLDIERFADGYSRVVHLGDWLINAFPMARWQIDAELKIGNEIWNDLPLDRTIQQIQSYRRVFSSRLHPLLCALCSADSVSFEEQRYPDDRMVSGKFESLLRDIFGRAFPERREFDVERQAVVAYKSLVAKRTEHLQSVLREMLE